MFQIITAWNSIRLEKDLGRVTGNIKSRGLITKRNKTTDLNNSEWILVFKKEA